MLTFEHNQLVLGSFLGEKLLIVKGLFGRAAEI